MKILSFIGLFLLSCGDSASHDTTQSNQNTSNKKKNKGQLHLIEIDEDLQPGNVNEIARGDDAFESVRKLVGDSAQLSRGDQALKYIQDQLNQ